MRIEKRNKFKMDLTPKKSYDTLKEKVLKSDEPKKKRKKRDFKQVSLLLDPEQYEKVAIKAEKEERSMTYIVKKYLSDTGFFDD